MHSEGLDALLVAVPLLLVLLAFMLRADESLATSEKRKKASDGRRRFAVADKDGENVLTDPDGKPFGSEGQRAKQPAAGSSRRSDGTVE
jgi:hypothetical protein